MTSIHDSSSPDQEINVFLVNLNKKKDINIFHLV